MKKIYYKTTLVFALLLVFHLAGQVSFAQLDGIERGRAKDMLKTVAKQVEKKYYDPQLRGIDLDAKVKAAEDKIDKAANLGQAFGIIAQVLLDFNDSHTSFIPPRRAVKFEYGWNTIMIGDKCYIFAVKPKSDAHKKGLKAGDLVLSVNGFSPNRSELWKMNYFYYQLNPQAAMKLVVQSPGEKPKEIITQTKINKITRRLNVNNSVDLSEILREANDDVESLEHRFIKKSGVVIWKMPTFAFDPNQVENIIDSHINGTSGLILDLRGNGGGYVDTLEKLVGFMFDKDVKIADVKSRKETEEVIAKTVGKDVYKGKIIVLIDSRSGSASEMFARVMQIEERGTVLGDTSAGAVMQSRFHPFTMGVNTQIFYGASITEAEVLNTDGKSLENVGVTPDEKILMTGADLANERDPVLARAAEIMGVKISSDDAGKFFPFYWADGKKGNVTALSK